MFNFQLSIQEYRIVSPKKPHDTMRKTHPLKSHFKKRAIPSLQSSVMRVTAFIVEA